MRERILNEIKRLAAERDGIAPGKHVFQRETGITESEWYGKLWLRWNDAVIDAGLTPNEKQERISSDLVLDKYAEVCRHYGKAPSSAELRYYARTAPDFVSHNTFAKHFGSKTGIIIALRERALERNEEDILAILPDLKAQKSPSTDTSLNTYTEGWVYLLQ
jgi:hypothetical protein